MSDAGETSSSYTLFLDCKWHAPIACHLCASSKVATAAGEGLDEPRREEVLNKHT